jgi:hypothetical protein
LRAFQQGQPGGYILEYILTPFSCAFRWKLRASSGPGVLYFYRLTVHHPREQLCLRALRRVQEHDVWIGTGELAQYFFSLSSCVCVSLGE